MALRILMLGWEFPPFITGGLGTACYGLTRALDRQHVEVTFVLPKSVPPDSASHVRLVSPGSVLERAGSRLPAPPNSAGGLVSSPSVSEPVRNPPEWKPEADPTEPMTVDERAAWTSVVKEFTTTNFIEIPGIYPSVYDDQCASLDTASFSPSPASVAEGVRLMREAGWSIERIRTLARAGAFPEVMRDPVERAKIGRAHV